MNIVAWARVSSVEQVNGYSLDAQMRAIHERAARDGATIIREFSVAESAKRGADREQFNAMLDWVRANAKKENIRGILAHKLDRLCRNMRDAVRLQDLEQIGIKLYFIENQFGPGAAGLLSFNIIASVSQFHSDNLKCETRKGLYEKCAQGWMPGHAPFGYMNDTADKTEPIKIHPVNGAIVQRMFELFLTGDFMPQAIAHELNRQGYTFRRNQPKFYHGTVNQMLKNPFYAGTIVYAGRAFEGRHKPLISREQFEQCQTIFAGRKRARHTHGAALAGGLIRCACCGAGITVERVKKRLKSGEENLHDYYSCWNAKNANHKPVRWRGADVDAAILEQMSALKMPSTLLPLFKETVNAVLADEAGQRARVEENLKHRESELAKRKDRLVEGYLSGVIDAETHAIKAAEIARELNAVRADLQAGAQVTADVFQSASAIIDSVQNLAERWRGSNLEARRKILAAVSLNRTLDDAKLSIQWTSPFDAFAKCAELREGTG